ncbi:MAG: EF-hand domain-containing protein [Vulcanimicrobiota bacterium]
MASMMLSELQRKKLTRKFKLLDFDNNGAIEQADFQRVLENLAQHRNLSLTSHKLQGLRKTVDKVWSALHRFCDADHDGQVTLDEWLSFHHEAIRHEREMLESLPGHESTIDAMTALVFELLDVEGDGRIGLGDYQHFCRAYGVPDEEIRPSFAKLDRNGDGYLSRAEILQLVIEFYCSDDPNSPGNHFFGQLAV